MKRITDWKGCLDTLTSKNIKPDEGMIKSLLETSRKKLASAEMLRLSDTTAESKFSLCYDSMREALEALAIKKGYKIYNHECYTYFLKEVIGDSSKGDEFDSLRKVRNAVNYYGRKLDSKQSRKLIKRIVSLRNFVLMTLNSEKEAKT